MSCNVISDTCIYYIELYLHKNSTSFFGQQQKRVRALNLFKIS